MRQVVFHLSFYLTQNTDYITPLHIACDQGLVDIVTILLTAEPEIISAVDLENMTPLHK